jgi:hypothetical protein
MHLMAVFPRALRLSAAYRQPAGLRNTIRLLDWLRRKGKRETSLREIMQLGPHLGRSAKPKAALAMLEEHDWLTGYGDRRSARWTLAAEAGA